MPAQQVEFLLSQVRNAANGSLAGGSVTFYAAGTTTLKAIYLDRLKATQAANPYTLDTDGTAQIYADGLYKVVIKNSLGSTIYTRDNLSFSASIISAESTSLETFGGGISASAAANTAAWIAAVALNVPIVLQPGTYNFSSNITALNAPEIRGVPGKTILKPAAGVTGVFLTVSTTNNTALQMNYPSRLGFSIDGSLTTGCTGLKIDWVPSQYVAQVLMENVEVYGFDVGLHIGHTVYVETRMCSFMKNGNNCYINGGSLISHNTSFSQADAAIGTTAHAGRGVVLDTSASFMGSFNKFENNDAGGIYVISGGTNQQISVNQYTPYFENNHVDQGTPANFYHAYFDNSVGTNPRMAVSLINSFTDSGTGRCKFSYFKTVTNFVVDNFLSTAGDSQAGMISVNSTCYGRINLPYNWVAGAVSDDGTNIITGELSAGSKKVSFTRDMSAASGSQVIDAIGFRPSLVKLTAGISTGLNAASIGDDDGTDHTCIYNNGIEIADTWLRTDGASIFINYSPNNSYAGYLSMNADGFTVAWTRNNSPAGTLTVDATVFR